MAEDGRGAREGDGGQGQKEADAGERGKFPGLGVPALSGIFLRLFFGDVMSRFWTMVVKVPMSITGVFR